MRPYLSRSPVAPVAVFGRRRIALPVPDQLPELDDRARLLLAEHVVGVDGWCAGCLAAGRCYFWPCPEVTGLLRRRGEPVAAPTLAEGAAA